MTKQTDAECACSDHPYCLQCCKDHFVYDTNDEDSPDYIKPMKHKVEGGMEERFWSKFEEYKTISTTKPFTEDGDILLPINEIIPFISTEIAKAKEKERQRCVKYVSKWFNSNTDSREIFEVLNDLGKLK